MKIAIANDHAAVEMKQEIMEYLRELGHEVTDYGRTPMTAAITRTSARRWAGLWLPGRRTAVF